MNLLSKVDIINQVAESYNLNNRSINNDVIGLESCVYTTVDGKHCAVGKYLKPEHQTVRFGQKHFCGALVLINNVFNKDYDKLFIPEVAHIKDAVFWNNLQEFHDIAFYWNETGLSETGEAYKNYLLEKYK